MNFNEFVKEIYTSYNKIYKEFRNTPSWKNMLYHIFLPNNIKYDKFGATQC